jgi:hypothetical protein
LSQADERLLEDIAAIIQIGLVEGQTGHVWEEETYEAG